jgi:ATP-dependent DNA helicase DinG
MQKITITKITQQAFAQGGPLSKFVKHYVPNPVQIEYATKVAQCFDAGTREQTSIGLIEAGTGIGKTLGYAIPLLAYAALSDRRVAISTYTIQLQSQLISAGGDIEIARQVIQELTERRLTVAPRLGLRNFVSPLRIRAALAMKGIRAPSEPVNKLIHWAETSKTGLFLEWNRLHGELPAELLMSEICCEPYLPESEKLRYLAHKDYAKNADVIITNHSLTLLHARSKEFSVLDAPDEKPISIIVADEADRIESAAELLSQRSAALMSVRSLFDKNDDPASQAIANGIRTICDMASRVDNRMDAHVNLLNNPVLSSEIDFQISQILPYFDQALKSCSDNEQIADMVLHKKSLSEFRTRLSQDSSSTIPIIHFSEVRRYPSLRAVDPRPGTSFGWLWHDDSEQDKKPYLEAALLTSATLSDGKETSLKAVANSLGLFMSSNYCLTIGIFEPAKFGELSIVLPDENAPTPTISVADDEFSSDPDWIVYVSDMIAKASASGERVLALTLSYRDTRMIAANIRLRHPQITTLIQHTEIDPIQELLTRFSETDGAILLSPSCWEGINLPGLVKNLVITRIPFSPPDHSMAEIIKNSMVKRGFSPSVITATIYGRSVTSTRRKLRQAIGRGIRQLTDVSCVWFCDKRVLTQNGKLNLASCLPTRFHPALKTASTFTLDRVVQSKKPELLEQPKPIAWPKQRVYL